MYYVHVARLDFCFQKKQCNSKPLRSRCSFGFVRGNGLRSRKILEYADGGYKVERVTVSIKLKMSCRDCKYFSYIAYQPNKKKFVCSKSHSYMRVLTDQFLAVPDWCPEPYIRTYQPKYQFSGKINKEFVEFIDEKVQEYMTELMSDSIGFILKADELRKEISDLVKRRIEEIEDEGGTKFTLDMISSSYNVADNAGTKNSLVMEIHLSTERK